jgi:hypothetical protein
VFSQFGDLERCALRAGSVKSAYGGKLLDSIVARHKGTVEGIAFRGDAAFAQPNMHEFVEVQGIAYAIRLPANQILPSTDRSSAQAAGRAAGSYAAAGT